MTPTDRPNIPRLFFGGLAAGLGPEWVERHVRNGHGPLGAAYPNYRGGDPWGRVYEVKEGDTRPFCTSSLTGWAFPNSRSWEVGAAALKAPARAIAAPATRGMARPASALRC